MLESKNLKKYLILFLLLLLILAGFFLIYKGFNKSKSTNSTDLSNNRNIKNIIFDHKRNNVFLITDEGNKIDPIKNINFSKDDTILNIQNNFLVLHHYNPNLTGTIKSHVFDIKNSLDEVYSREGEEIFYYKDSNNYAYNNKSSNLSYIKTDGKDHLLSNLNGQSFVFGNISPQNNLLALNNKGIIDILNTNNGGYIANGFSGLDEISTYFTLTDKGRYIAATNAETNKSYLYYFEGYNEDKKQQEKPTTTIELSHTPTLLNIKDNLIYFSAVADEAKYKNYQVDLNTKEVKELTNFPENEEILY